MAVKKKKKKMDSKFPVLSLAVCLTFLVAVSSSLTEGTSVPHEFFVCAGVQALLERITGAPASAASTQRRRCRRHRNAQKAPVCMETKRAFNGKANLIPACDL